MKECKKCKLCKSLEDFHKDSGSKDGLYRWCKSCKREYDINYRQSEKIQALYKSKEYRDRKMEYKKWRDKTDPRIQIFNSAKARAKKYEIPFNLEVEDIELREYCPLLGIKLERKPYGKGGSFQPNSPSLDKIIPELGYVKGNIEIISMKANIMKSNATINELKTFADNILRWYGNN